MAEQAAHNRCVAGSNPALATRATSRWCCRYKARSHTMASKASDVRPKITLACGDCKDRNYITRKNRRNDPDRIELKKFCPKCGKHTTHKETR